MSGMILSVSKDLFNKYSKASSIKRLGWSRIHFSLHSKRSLVEVRGVEPRSEIKIQRTSTYIVCFFLTLSCQTDKDHLESVCC